MNVDGHIAYGKRVHGIAPSSWLLVERESSESWCTVWHAVHSYGLLGAEIWELKAPSDLVLRFL